MARDPDQGVAALKKQGIDLDPVTEAAFREAYAEIPEPEAAKPAAKKPAKRKPPVRR